jgi:hypothetical protein
MDEGRHSICAADPLGVGSAAPAYQPLAPRDPARAEGWRVVKDAPMLLVDRLRTLDPGAP